MLKVATMVCRHISSTEEWEEDCEVPEGRDPLEYCTQLIEDFNAVERERQTNSFRTLVKIVKVTDSESQWCIYHKKNLVTLQGRSGMYDLYECEVCKHQFKRHNLGGIPKRKCRGPRA